ADARTISRHRTARRTWGKISFTGNWRLSRERPEGPADWLRPQPQRTWPTGSKLCRAHPERRASRRVTVPRPHAFRLRHQHADRQSGWPFDAGGILVFLNAAGLRIGL